MKLFTAICLMVFGGASAFAEESLSLGPVSSESVTLEEGTAGIQGSGSCLNDTCVESNSIAPAPSSSDGNVGATLASTGCNYSCDYASDAAGTSLGGVVMISMVSMVGTTMQVPGLSVHLVRWAQATATGGVAIVTASSGPGVASVGI